MVGQIKEASESINTAAQEIGGGNADPSARTEEQASSPEETASSMEEPNATVRQNGQRAPGAELASREQRGGGAGRGDENWVVGTMGSIQESLEEDPDIIR